MMQVRQKRAETSELQIYIDFSNSFYRDLLGYKPEQTSLRQIPESQWNEFAKQKGTNPNSGGIYFPRNQTAFIRGENPLSLFHEYFGHGLYCEQSLAGRKLVELERKLLEEEKVIFNGKKFTLQDLEKFRRENRTFQELEEFRKQNLAVYELFAIWTEFLLSGEFGLRDNFGEKYDSLEKNDREVIDRVINFSERYGNLAAFYDFGLARRTTPERVKRLLEDVYSEKDVRKSKLILLTGSKKPFSDIDLFASSNYLQPLKNKVLDLIVFGEDDFERRVRLFEIQVTHPIISGKFISGKIEYLKQKKEQLKTQPITDEAIQHNLQRAEANKNFAEQTNIHKDEVIGFSYYQTYLANALALKEGKRLFTKEDLLSYSRSEKFIELKGGAE